MNNVLFGSEIKVILHLLSLQKFSNFQFTTFKCFSLISVQGFQINLKKKKKKKGYFAPTRALLWTPLQLQSFLALPKTGQPIFLLYYPLVPGMLTSLTKTYRKYI